MQKCPQADAAIKLDNLSNSKQVEEATMCSELVREIFSRMPENQKFENEKRRMNRNSNGGMMVLHGNARLRCKTV